MRTVATPDGRTLTVREAGVAGGIPVLVQNGTPGSSLLYEPHVLDAEAKGIHLFSYDRPGYGGSTRNEGRSVADCVPDAEAVCDALGIGRFVTWGISGGGPHAIAVATLMPDRCAAAAALAPVAPYDAPGLDFFAGMGEQNVEEFGIVARGDHAAHEAALARDAEELLAATPDGLVDAWSTLLGPADVEVVNGRLAAYILAAMRAGIEDSLWGWFDDDVAFVEPWGFELDWNRTPLLHWQGAQDKMVPFGHGEWLAARLPATESRLSPEEGHLTLVERHVPEVHDWLLDRFEQ
jgi:pimeloyl-ACP methyl ester carboxylesterase